MKKVLVVSFLALLAGCQSVPVMPEFPQAVDELKVACPDLQLVPPDTTKLSDTIAVIVSNYGKYHECRAKVDGWIEWYDDQKKIYDQIKK